METERGFFRILKTCCFLFFSCPLLKGPDTDHQNNQNMRVLFKTRETEALRCCGQSQREELRIGPLTSSKRQSLIRRAHTPDKASNPPTSPIPVSDPVQVWMMLTRSPGNLPAPPQCDPKTLLLALCRKPDGPASHHILPELPRESEEENRGLPRLLGALSNLCHATCVSGK